MSRNIFSRNIISLFSILFLGVVLSLTFFSGSALAARSFTMKQVVVDAEVLPDASMKVTERITVDFSGQWNGFYVKIPQGSTPIKEVTVKENGKPYTLNSGTEYGPPGTYLTKTEGSQVLIDWSISASDEVRTFDVSYRVINAVKIYSDAAELYRKFIGEANGNKISSVQVNLKLPPGAEKYKQGEEIRIWGHGPLIGEVEFSGTDTVVWSAKNLPAYTFLEGRVVMPAALFTAAPAAAFTNQAGLAGILAEEERWANEANRERLKAKAEYIGGAGIIAGALAGVFLLWRRFGRSHKAGFTGDYYRELPTGYSPAELSVLWNFRKMKAQDITATILDLARRKFIYLEEQTVEERKLLGTKATTTYLLSFLPTPEPSALRKPEEAVLRPHEQKLIEFLQNNIGGGKGPIYLTDIEKYAKKYGESFYQFWKEWTSVVIAQGAEYEFFDHNGNMPALTIFGGLGLFVLGSVLLAKVGVGVIGYALVIAGAIFLFIPRLFKRRSISGQEDYVRWQAFKKFLQHFSEMQRHEIPSLIIWEHYLVFAVTLGVAKEVIKQLELVFPNMQDGDYRFGYGWMTYGAYSSLNSLNQSFDGIGSSFDRALQSAEKAVSKKSSGSGGGGGFSGGGGGGGGGSSYGGR
jgi:Predicted membrane protein